MRRLPDLTEDGRGPLISQAGPHRDDPGDLDEPGEPGELDPVELRTRPSGDHEQLIRRSEWQDGDL
jgi:hypothetical protein